MKNRILLIAVVALVSLAADQITKRMAIRHLKPEGWPKQCHPRCEKGNKCPGRWTCDKSTKICQLPTQKCKKHKDCDKGASCFAGQCVRWCHRCPKPLADGESPLGARCSPWADVIPGYLALQYAENPGSAFGMLRSVPGSRYILIGIGVLALVLVWTIIRKVDRGQKVADVAFGLVAGGAVGNLVDRIYIGRVVDFVLMHVSWHPRWRWPHYNVADALLVAGVILLLLVLGRKPKTDKAEPARKPSKGKARRKKKS